MKSSYQRETISRIQNFKATLGFLRRCFRSSEQVERAGHRKATVEPGRTTLSQQPGRRSQPTPANTTVDAIINSLYEIVSRPALKKLLTEEETAERLAWQRSRSPPQPAEPLWYLRTPVDERETKLTYAWVFVVRLIFIEVHARVRRPPA